ncbi:12465_t:CDS:2, partial [Entrophospora sp. SA101]
MSKLGVILHNELKKYYNAGKKETRIEIDTYDLISETLFHWACTATKIDIFQNPYFIVPSEDVIDTGGGFRDATHKLWEDLRNKGLKNNSLELIGNYIFLAENQTSIGDKFGFILGKLLIWCLLHGGAWPSWLHPMHLHYICDKNINYIEIFKELNPNIYNCIKKLESGDNSHFKDVIDYAKHYNENRIFQINRKDIANHISKFVILDSRKNVLDDLKKGFNYFDQIQTLRNMNFTKILSALYIKLEGKMVWCQFDHVYNEKIFKNEKAKSELYTLLKNWVLNQNETTLDKFLKFITGCNRFPVKEKIKVHWRVSNSKKMLGRIPMANTCSCVLILCENFELSEGDKKAFEESLVIA